MVEIPLYSPSGEGEYLFFKVTKIDYTTEQCAKAIAQHLDIKYDKLAWAGMKDTYATTTQWLSVHAPSQPLETLRASFLKLNQEHEHVHIHLETLAWHPKALKAGHLHANHFVIRLKNCAAHLNELSGRLDMLQMHGLPNYFGHQRFGRAFQNIQKVLPLTAFLEQRRPKWKQRFYISVLQSAIFNVYLSERIARGLYTTAIPGDVMRKEDTGGVFTSDPSQESYESLASRMATWDISPTGPMPGKRMRPALLEAHTLEADAMRAFGVHRGSWSRRLGPGTRRACRIRPKHGEVIIDENNEHDLKVSFTLPSGSYATMVLRELAGRDSLI